MKIKLTTIRGITKHLLVRAPPSDKVQLFCFYFLIKTISKKKRVIPKGKRAKIKT